ncbi:glucose-6-phosphate 1-dehydrogenas, putative [Candida dubliniensis CD36]|uniref:Glucose-6-phosphate 1-dehydrogenase n=1 Tax=Candida dubliniensis (strain CD36 / ATCC MYA-646 / CBS 7987 / NCPF 3949 / NRRL Y-17841) TaxID=573826 RepID=B9W8S1_CANDC|nr:glucose-6-phosphate 1-dehydrogenas, putative [Candida dubliniensis CD36]CAX45144.1 glucose-6-phosphate 1-dehydrogenas, putative [Candida dubliniensis CD36]
MSFDSFGDYATIVVFGASGDLAKKKTFPALFGLFREKQLPSTVQIIGYARSHLEDEEFKQRISEHFKGGDDKIKQDFLKLVSYISGPYDTDEGYKKLESRCQEYEQKNNQISERLFYLALPPSVFTTVCEKVKKNVYPPKEGKLRIIIEKPFGRDLDTYRAMQKEISPLFTEDEIYRIDHYLGKEMVKNLLVLRFGNELFSGVWNNKHISSIQVSFKEAFGTEGRGGYFDTIGIIRDVMQNHLLQVLTLLTMERPVSFDPEAVRDEKVKVLKAFDNIDVNDVILGQYTKSEDGTKPGYLDDKTVNPDSKAVTYAAFRVNIHNERWDGVPIVLRAGKALDESKVEIRIQFKPVAKGMFKEIQRNELVIRIQPNEAIYLKINSKIPGISTETSLTDLDLTYATRYSKDFWIPEAYEALIRDCYLGNHSNFVRDDELDVSWKLFTPLLKAVEDPANKIELQYYPYGSKGPKDLRKYLKDHGYIFSDPGTYQWPLTSPNVKGKI